jgi:hypothetical protein
MTPDEYQARLHRYCQAYGLAAAAEGPPPYPSGQRETPQHREWLALYKAYRRLGAPQGDSAELRARLTKAQKGACPICGRPVGISDPVARGPETGEPRAVLHRGCLQIVGLVQAQGPEVLQRVAAYLASDPPARTGRKGRD